MKKLATFVFALLLGASLSLAQATGGTTTKDTKKGATTKGKGHPHSSVALNPQPEPPGAQNNTSTSPGSKVELNPQPLPPRVQNNTGTSPASKVELNPQPLPPGAAASTNNKDKKKGKKGTLPTGTTNPK